jgi:hypothetical protein
MWVISEYLYNLSIVLLVMLLINSNCYLRLILFLILVSEWISYSMKFVICACSLGSRKICLALPVVIVTVGYAGEIILKHN